MAEDSKKQEQEKPLSEGTRRARRRPSNYHELSAREQWEIDKRLGILDWDGS